MGAVLLESEVLDDFSVVEEVGATAAGTTTTAGGATTTGAAYTTAAGGAATGAEVVVLSLVVLEFVFVLSAKARPALPNMIAIPNDKAAVLNECFTMLSP